MAYMNTPGGVVDTSSWTIVAPTRPGLSTSGDPTDRRDGGGDWALALRSVQDPDVLRDVVRAAMHGERPHAVLLGPERSGRSTVLAGVRAALGGYASGPMGRWTGCSRLHTSDPGPGHLRTVATLGTATQRPDGAVEVVRLAALGPYADRMLYGRLVRGEGGQHGAVLRWLLR